MVKAAALALTLAPARLPTAVVPAPSLTPSLSLAAPVLPTAALASPVLPAVNAALPALAVSAKPAVAAALAAAPDRPAARAALESLGVAAAPVADRSAVDESLFWSILWDASDGVRHAVDDSWAVPAVRVERGGVAYYIHPVAHGQLMPHGRGAVARLARQVEKAGGALYWEQNLPAFYGVPRGREVRDHAVLTDDPVTVLPADRPETRLAALRRRAEAALVYGLPAAAAAWALNSPAEPAAWVLLAALGAFAWAALTSLRPLMRGAHIRDAIEAGSLGMTDLARRLSREAEVWFASRLDARALGRLDVPLSLADAADPVVRRSVALADAVAADAAAAEVHVVAGYRHAYHMADRLAEGPK